MLTKFSHQTLTLTTCLSALAACNNKSNTSSAKPAQADAASLPDASLTIPTNAEVRINASCHYETVREGTNCQSILNQTQQAIHVLGFRTCTVKDQLPVRDLSCVGKAYVKGGANKISINPSPRYDETDPFISLTVDCHYSTVEEGQGCLITINDIYEKIRLGYHCAGLEDEYGWASLECVVPWDSYETEIQPDTGPKE